MPDSMLSAVGEAMLHGCEGLKFRLALGFRQPSSGPGYKRYFFLLTGANPYAIHSTVDPHNASSTSVEAQERQNRNDMYRLCTRRSKSSLVAACFQTAKHLASGASGMREENRPCLRIEPLQHNLQHHASTFT